MPEIIANYAKRSNATNHTYTQGWNFKREKKKRERCALHTEWMRWGKHKQTHTHTRREVKEGKEKDRKRKHKIEMKTVASDWKASVHCRPREWKDARKTRICIGLEWLLWYVCACLYTMLKRNYLYVRFFSCFIISLCCTAFFEHFEWQRIKYTYKKREMKQTVRLFSGIEFVQWFHLKSCTIYLNYNWIPSIRLTLLSLVHSTNGSMDHAHKAWSITSP